MKKPIYRKIIAISIGLCVFPLISNANDVRGSIITKDNKIVAQSINEKMRDYPLKDRFEPIILPPNLRYQLLRMLLKFLQKEEN